MLEVPALEIKAHSQNTKTGSDLDTRATPQISYQRVYVALDSIKNGKFDAAKQGADVAILEDLYLVERLSDNKFKDITGGWGKYIKARDEKPVLEKEIEEASICSVNAFNEISKLEKKLGSRWHRLRSDRCQLKEERDLLDQWKKYQETIDTNLVSLRDRLLNASDTLSNFETTRILSDSCFRHVGKAFILTSVGLDVFKKLDFEVKQAQAVKEQYEKEYPEALKTYTETRKRHEELFFNSFRWPFALKLSRADLDEKNKILADATALPVKFMILDASYPLDLKKYDLIYRHKPKPDCVNVTPLSASFQKQRNEVYPDSATYQQLVFYKPKAGQEMFLELMREGKQDEALRYLVYSDWSFGWKDKEIIEAANLLVNRPLSENLPYEAEKCFIELVSILDDESFINLATDIAKKYYDADDDVEVVKAIAFLEKIDYEDGKQEFNKILLNLLKYANSQDHYKPQMYIAARFSEVLENETIKAQILFAMGKLDLKDLEDNAEREAIKALYESLGREKFDQYFPGYSEKLATAELESSIKKESTQGNGLSAEQKGNLFFQLADSLPLEHRKDYCIQIAKEIFDNEICNDSSKTIDFLNESKKYFTRNFNDVVNVVLEYSSEYPIASLYIINEFADVISKEAIKNKVADIITNALDLEDDIYDEGDLLSDTFEVIKEHHKAEFPEILNQVLKHCVDNGKGYEEYAKDLLCKFHKSFLGLGYALLVANVWELVAEHDSDPSSNADKLLTEISANNFIYNKVLAIVLRKSIVNGWENEVIRLVDNYVEPENKEFFQDELSKVRAESYKNIFDRLIKDDVENAKNLLSAIADYVNSETFSESFYQIACEIADNDYDDLSKTANFIKEYKLSKK